ncbi:MAG: hypothetical protein AVDCRST_MAG28-189 [uncultured Rubrobacteraceae bacterium]|uniref:Uncharacterized protein n=1 Tax=uncultured Rubrobacteraceae bacterium TaxID=349277 RepID=A0A6J4QL63_9ACTN|nr:MAG: hypothetical protein AVDCRST_MAG28-189 [uncultured Rubrobacteraceae bacterium]
MQLQRRERAERDRRLCQFGVLRLSHGWSGTLETFVYHSV